MNEPDERINIKLRRIDRQLGRLRDMLPKSTGQYVHPYIAELRDDLIKQTVRVEQLLEQAHLES